ncbi:hypothetical protein N9K16_05670 [Alphaproteobacteria bacterium]|nr:hypothetical protein [Alphaproteobacteria bacterium]
MIIVSYAYRFLKSFTLVTIILLAGLSLPMVLHAAETGAEPLALVDPDKAARDAVFKFASRPNQTGNFGSDTPSIAIQKESKETKKRKALRSVLNLDLVGVAATLFDETNAYIKAINEAQRQTITAAVSCDRALYNKALSNLIYRYLRAARYIERQLEEQDATVQAHFELARSNDPAAWPAQTVKKLKYSWLQLIGADEALQKFKELSPEAYRAYHLRKAYQIVWGGTLVRIRNIIKTEDYPRYRDCDESSLGSAEDIVKDYEQDSKNALEEAKRSLAETEAELELERAQEQERLHDGREEEVNVDGAVLPEEDSFDFGVVTPTSDSLRGSKFEEGQPLADPDFGSLVVTPQILIDVPEAPDLSEIQLPTTGVYAELLANPCGQSPIKVCSILLTQFRQSCAQELEGFYKICQSGPSITNCTKRCDGNWQQGKHELAISELAQNHIREVNSRWADELDNKLVDFEQRIAKIKQQIEDAKSTGQMSEEIERLEALLNQQQTDMENLADFALDNSQWMPMALSKWQPDPNKVDGHCTAAENDENYEGCLMECSGETSGQIQHSCYSSFVPHLAFPYGRAWLYPPGHPESNPAR